MQELGILKYLTILHVVTFGVAKACFQVLSNGVERRILSRFQLCLDVIESYRPLDLGVIVGVLSSRGKAHELEGGNLASDDM